MWCGGPGAVSVGTWNGSVALRIMLQHLTKTLHPGVLNDCFYQPSTALCAKRAKHAGRPLPLLTMCLLPSE